MKKAVRIAAAVCLPLILMTACGGEVGTSSDRETSRRVTAAQTTTANANVLTTAPASAAGETVFYPGPGSGSGVSCADITAAVLEAVEMSSMTEVGADRIGMYIDYDIPEGTDFSMYICGSGGFADEVCVISTEGIDEAAFEDAVRKRLEAREKDFEDYNPDEYDKLQNSFFKSTDKYFMYSVTSDNEECERIFDEFVKN